MREWLELTNLPPSQFSSMQESFVQILHVFENHWITICGLKDLNEIRVYDSLNYTKDKKYPKKKTIIIKDDKLDIFTI